MSHGNRVAEQRKLRKAVGHDAMQLMGAMSAILDERVFPTQALQADTIRLLVERMTTLEGIVQGLAKRAPVASEQRTGAEVV